MPYLFCLCLQDRDIYYIFLWKRGVEDVAPYNEQHSLCKPNTPPALPTGRRGRRPLQVRQYNQVSFKIPSYAKMGVLRGKSLSPMSFEGWGYIGGGGSKPLPPIRIFATLSLREESVKKELIILRQVCVIRLYINARRKQS